jgi:kynurenine formamidase
LDAAAIPSGATRLFVKTRNAGFWDDAAFHDDFIGFAEDAGPWLAERGFVLVVSTICLSTLSLAQSCRPPRAPRSRHCDRRRS